MTTNLLARQRSQAMGAARTFRPNVPKEPTGIVELDAAIEVYTATLTKARDIAEKISATEKAMRHADTIDLRARAQAELGGKRDPGPTEVAKLEVELAKLTDRQRVLREATDTAATEIATTIDKHRDDMIATFEDQLEVARRAYAAVLEELATIDERLVSTQALRGWVSEYPGGRSLAAYRPNPKELGQILETLRGRASAAYLHRAQTPEQGTAIKGEGDAERYPEVNREAEVEVDA